MNSVHLDMISPITSVSNLRFKYENDEKKQKSDSDKNDTEENTNNVNNSVSFVTKLIDEDYD